MVTQLNVAGPVSITGRLPFREVEQRLSRADIGLIPHYATEAWNTTIPNKLFDYMALGLPVIVSEARPTPRIVEETACGEVFRDRNASDLARCILALTDPNGAIARRTNGRAAVRTRYNWTHDSRVFVDAVEAMGRRDAFSGGRR